MGKRQHSTMSADQLRRRPRHYLPISHFLRSLRLKLACYKLCYVIVRAENLFNDGARIMLGSQKTYFIQCRKSMESPRPWRHASKHYLPLAQLVGAGRDRQNTTKVKEWLY